jgi:O-antigen ligase
VPPTQGSVISAFPFSVVAGALTGLVQHVTGVDPFYGQEIRGPVRGSGIDIYIPKGLVNMTLTYGGMQVTLLLAMLPFVWRERGKGSKRFWVILLLTALSVYITYKRGPWLGAVAGTGLFLITRSRRTAVVVLVSGMILGGTLFAASSTFRSRVLDAVLMRTESEVQRVYLWDASVRMGADHPVLGVGPGGWSRLAPEYIRGDEDWVSMAHPHSDPLYLWSTTGALGLLAVLSVVAVFYSAGLRTLSSVDEQDMDYSLLQGGLLAAFGLLVMGIFQTYLTDGENMLTLGYIAGLALAAQRVLNERPVPPKRAAYIE